MTVLKMPIRCADCQARIPRDLEFAFGPYRQWRCRDCWMRQFVANPNLVYFLTSCLTCTPGGLGVLESVLDDPKNMPDPSAIIAAVLRQRTMEQMKRFYNGFYSFCLLLDDSREKAAQRVQDFIGSVWESLGWWRRLKWWLSCDIHRTFLTHHQVS